MHCGHPYAPVKYHALGNSWLLECTAAPPEWNGPALTLPRPSSSDRVILSAGGVRALLAGARPLDPALFIFHVSHCGSTLLARLLDADPLTRVLVEPDFIGGFLGRTYGASAARFARDARPMIDVCGLGGRPDQRLVIKFSSHALHRVEAIRALYPHVPALLVYREPREVLVRVRAKRQAFLRRRSPWLLALIGLNQDEATSKTDLDLDGAYIESLFQKASQHADRFDALVDYRELPHVVDGIRTGILGYPDGANPSDVRRIGAEYSKKPGQPYVAAHDDRPIDASIAARAQSIMPFYNVLETSSRFRNASNRRQSRRFA